MGHNTTIVVINDALDQIYKDPVFGANLAYAIREHSRSNCRVDVMAGNHANAAYVVETHHADQTALVTVGGNLGIAQLLHAGWAHHELPMQVKLLRGWAAKLGFKLVPLDE